MISVATGLILTQTVLRIQLYGVVICDAKKRYNMGKRILNSFASDFKKMGKKFSSATIGRHYDPKSHSFIFNKLVILLL